MKVRFLASAAVPTVLMMALTACGSASGGARSVRDGAASPASEAVVVRRPLPTRTVRFTARDYRFEGPARVSAGVLGGAFLVSAKNAARAVAASACQLAICRW